MRYYQLILTLIITSISSLAFTADLQLGFDAFKNGDYSGAINEWLPLAKEGNAVAQRNMALMYYNGNGVPQDYKAAIEWYSLAAAQGDPKAEYILGHSYDVGDGVPQDYKSALKWYTLATEHGHTDAPNFLGLMYLKGNGVSKDYVRAHMFFNLAAAYGNINGIKNRAELVKIMTPAQIQDAQYQEIMAGLKCCERYHTLSDYSLR